MSCMTVTRKIIQIELRNFKSYQGPHTIGPFKNFTAIIGPHIDGKSDLMEAIGFVLGVRDEQLRGAQQEEREAFVMLVYQDNEGLEVKLTSLINPDGSRTYKFDGVVMNLDEYKAKLKNIDILVDARNFLFQGELECIGSKTPKELTALIEQISGSDECKREYEELKKQKFEADDKAKLAHQNKESISLRKKQMEMHLMSNLANELDKLLKETKLMNSDIELTQEELNKVIQKRESNSLEATNLEREFRNLTKELEDLREISQGGGGFVPNEKDAEKFSQLKNEVNAKLAEFKRIKMILDEQQDVYVELEKNLEEDAHQFEYHKEVLTKYIEKLRSKLDELEPTRERQQQESGPSGKIKGLEKGIQQTENGEKGIDKNLDEQKMENRTRIVTEMESSNRNCTELESYITQNVPDIQVLEKSISDSVQYIYKKFCKDVGQDMSEYDKRHKNASDKFATLGEEFREKCNQLLEFVSHITKLEKTTAHSEAKMGDLVENQKLVEIVREKKNLDSEVLNEQEPENCTLDDYKIVSKEEEAALQEWEEANNEQHNATVNYNEIKLKRNKIFMDAFNHISDNIDKIYNELTKSNIHGVGGTTYMNLENPDEPYLGGINYIAMSQTLENLSGDEKTVAALALLFSIHSFKPSPFFILDEVDAALGTLNVATVADFIRAKSCGVRSDTDSVLDGASSFQSIVISAKDKFYRKADALVGVYHNSERGSQTLTFDLTKYHES
ncbi:structural maintenance of chromosomes protein 1-like isoform X2 [Salvia hispanica]|uniref:structural maintenance of chromosomes protein 1-like isoform X2 n=1 Tax=Salvia hispanica TaxID=49212 RepID=UPI0020094735|nr:structural maintenance of chromosomes protein 1-like isoform X2 [Salvia hispanica]